ncbi:MAG: hypothetical protein ACK4M9_09265 [Anaerobacillus sp.]|uniref:hypothetical protein n=1 Tax=Anaerobacillus sp. TaxID=1872506 RepID=UPI00391A33AB
MVIISLEECLNQLQPTVKEKIIQKQNEVMLNDHRNDLRERLSDSEFKKKLLSSLSENEKKYFIESLVKYSFYLNNSSVEEQPTSIEEKLALLLLRQKGIVYKLDDKKHKQQFIVPVEFIETYFQLSFLTEMKQRRPLIYSKKYYLYYLLETICLIKDKVIQNVSDLDLLEEKFSNLIKWEWLLDYLVGEGLIKYFNNDLVVINENCQRFFQLPNKEIQKRIMMFILATYYKENPFTSHLLLWCLFSKEVGINRADITQYAKRHESFCETEFNNVLQKLSILDILSISEDDVIFLADATTDPGICGMEAGILEFLVPVSINNLTLWTFRCWGKISQWDFMTHITLTKETVSQALIEGRDAGALDYYLQSYLSKDIYSRWKPTLKQWLEEGAPITKKDQLVFYSIPNKLHRKYVEEHWHGWWEQTSNGIVIENSSTDVFEKLLRKLSLNVMIPKKDDCDQLEKLEVVINNEFPHETTVIPEVARLPKQWFVLTRYEERIIQRIVKQAIVLELWLQVETTENEIIKLLPMRIANKNGTYEIITNEKRRLSLSEIVKLAVIHPLKS